MLLDFVGSVSPQSLRWISIEQAETKVKRLPSRKPQTIVFDQGYRNGHIVRLLQKLVFDVLI